MSLNELKRDGRTVYVPVADSPLRNLIRRGSGIVGTPIPGTRTILVDYEGNIYGAPSMNDYDMRVAHAYDRHVWKDRGYPTTARTIANADELLEVGFLEIVPSGDGYTWKLHVDRQDIVDEWCAS